MIKMNKKKEWYGWQQPRKAQNNTLKEKITTNSTSKTVCYMMTLFHHMDCDLSKDNKWGSFNLTTKNYKLLYYNLCFILNLFMYVNI